MSGWFSINIWLGGEQEETPTKQGFTRGAGENHNTLRFGPLRIAFGIEGRE